MHFTDAKSSQQAVVNKGDGPRVVKTLKNSEEVSNGTNMQISKTIFCIV